MFNSAVKANCSRAKSAATLNSPNKDFAAGTPTHTNGLILSTRDALFLARFLATLSKTYVSLCESPPPSPQTPKQQQPEEQAQTHSPVRTLSFTEDSPQQLSADLSSPESLSSPLKRQATGASVLYRDSPLVGVAADGVGVHRLRFDVYQTALKAVLEEFSEEDTLYYGR